MQFVVFSLFPELLESYCAVGMLGKAQERGLFDLKTVNFRAFGVGRHKQVDDTPYGGGPGMLLKVEPLVAAFESSKVQPLVLLSPSGEPLQQKMLEDWAKLASLGLVCGRYEGFDARVKAYVDCEVSLGPYVLMGGELAALAIIEGVARLIPGVLGNPSSPLEETGVEGLEYPQYTKPREFQGLGVPDVLLKGDHAAIAAWRKNNRKL